jgi:hypothetical protein
MDGSNLMKLVQHKLAEKEEVIHEQQSQLTEMSEALREKDEMIRELLAQIGDGSGAPPLPESELVQEKEMIIIEQMKQILELSDRLEQLEARVADFDKQQRQIKEMLGE